MLSSNYYLGRQKIVSLYIIKSTQPGLFSFSIATTTSRRPIFFQIVIICCLGSYAYNYVFFWIIVTFVTKLYILHVLNFVSLKINEWEVWKSLKHFQQHQRVRRRNLCNDLGHAKTRLKMFMHTFQEMSYHFLFFKFCN